MKSVKNVNRIKIANKKVSRSQVKARVGTVHYSMKIRVGNVWYIIMLLNLYCTLLHENSGRECTVYMLLNLPYFRL